MSSSSPIDPQSVQQFLEGVITLLDRFGLRAVGPDPLELLAFHWQPDLQEPAQGSPPWFYGTRQRSNPSV